MLDKTYSDSRGTPYNLINNIGVKKVSCVHGTYVDNWTKTNKTQNQINGQFACRWQDVLYDIKNNQLDVWTIFAEYTEKPEKLYL